MKNRNIAIAIALVLFIASVFAASTYARRNYLGKSKSLNTPSQTPTSMPTVTLPPSTPSPKPNITEATSPKPSPTFTNTPKPAQQGSTVSIYITYYGWNDNDPPGTDIAYPKSDYPASVHSSAGGSGTFTDPVTFASDPNLYPVGTKLYIPYIKKYVIMEDSCASCIKDYKDGKKHIDIWAGGNGNNEDKLLACEEYWTRDSMTIEIGAQNGMEVNTTPIFNSGNAMCLN